MPERRWHDGSEQKNRRKNRDRPQTESKGKFSENHMPRVSEGVRKDRRYSVSFLFFRRTEYGRKNLNDNSDKVQF